jgi:dolichyl-phosphate beta-glucosyltransferase
VNATPEPIGPKPGLSIVLPAFNEAARIGKTLERIGAWAARREPRPEIIVVDDGSSDATAAVVEAHAASGVRLVRLDRNLGKGAALRAGVLASRGEHVLLCDADLSTPIEEVDRLTLSLREADLVLGSRDLPDSRVVRHQPWPRELSGKLFNLAIRALGVRGFRDTQCGFKLLRGAVARRLFAQLTVERFAYDVELVWLAQRAGDRIVEVGVEWHNDPATRVRMFRDGFGMLVDVLRFRSRHRGEVPHDASGGEGRGR